MHGKSGSIRNTRGVILIDFLLTVLIMILLVPAVMICLRSVQGTMEINEEVQDAIAEAQLRQILMIASDKKMKNGTLEFTGQDRTMRLSFVNDHLIIQPGTQIFFSAVDSGYLKTEGNLIYAVYTRKNTTYEKVIGILS